MRIPPPLSPQEAQLLLALYRHQFDRGSDTTTEGLDWVHWARDAGEEVEQTRQTVEELTGRYLVEDDDAFGARLRLRLGGILWAERSPLADPEFVARQKAIRRGILAALVRVKDREHPFSGRSIERLAQEIGEPVGDVLANYGVLRDMGFVTGASSGKLIRIADEGAKTLGNGSRSKEDGQDGQDGYVGWPLG